MVGTVIFGLVLASSCHSLASLSQRYGRPPTLDVVHSLLTPIWVPQLRQRWRFRAHRSQLPPGPKTIRTGVRKPWLWFQELTKEYGDGDVVYIQMGPTPTIILGSAQAAWDLLEKRGAIYSSRPRFIMGGELLSGGMRGLMAPSSAFWRRWRKALHNGFMQRQSESYRPIQNLESRVLMHDLLTNPKEFRTHLERYAASVIVTVTYGRRVEDARTDAVVRANAESMSRLTSVNNPGKFAIERYPALKYVPSIFAPWKAEVLRQRQKDINMYLGLVNEVKDKMKREVAVDCFTTYLIDKQENHGLDDLELAYAAGSPFGAGVETSAGSLASFLLACVKFGQGFIPKAQAELDKVVGSDRLPTFEDMVSLPYVTAIVSETLRWRPITVLGGTPRASIADDTYRGMFILKGSIVIAPLWSIHLNENDFPDPHRLLPECFLEERQYPGLFGHSAFGWGRRVCPGLHLGHPSVTLNIARILWGFNVSLAKNERGENIEVDMLVNLFAFSDGFNSSPLPFECLITARSSKHVQVIEQEFQDALRHLKNYAADSED
ncbi:cytochrome P450 [Pseudoneurospora amorphoporcata]|uniref:Cytochrome P450 n=1 Tax=Pseudoneurospora amorphoporcata TaxID=241081 RepID=A0AAN6NR95_9PEZI|nr:cytochrome P450 [Pseudoneurospora amorphoporcata]